MVTSSLLMLTNGRLICWWSRTFLIVGERNCLHRLFQPVATAGCFSDTFNRPTWVRILTFCDTKHCGRWYQKSTVRECAPASSGSYSTAAFMFYDMETAFFFGCAGPSACAFILSRADGTSAR